MASGGGGLLPARTASSAPCGAVASCQREANVPRSHPPSLEGRTPAKRWEHEKVIRVCSKTGYSGVF